MKTHKAAKDVIGERYVRNPLSDGKKRNKWGYLIKACEIAGCMYKTGNTPDMKMHKDLGEVQGAG